MDTLSGAAAVAIYLFADRTHMHTVTMRKLGLPRATISIKY
jgi:hypothetical protein